MKNNYFTLILILTCAFGFSQNSITVILKNDKIIKGSGVLKRKFVKIKKVQKVKSQKIDIERISKIIYKKKGKSTTFYFFKDNEDDLISYLQLVIDGNMNLYSKSFINSTGYGAFESTHYYLKRDNESNVVMLGGGTVWDNFKKESAEYLKDCPTLVKNISESKKGFAKKDVKKIVRFYNSKCR
ncbi:hypothetical protein [Jejuia spongiicola]|uniref:Uncharacterized protein n=1 Tax=Jejuia spongiicola TaxID=2942207 RepID=A0ABT0QI59_9FLAO|nr:hypothetical protein [Jejuia spongiicola]MCL6296529.1 hypothetical protein [Jejuia spongiicola]